MQAQGSGTSANEAKQALVGLSPFVSAGGGSPAPSAQVAYLTPQYLADRRDMLSARMALDAAELGYGERLFDYSVLRGATSTDIDSSIILAIADSVTGYEG